MNELSIFQFETQPVRIITLDGRPWWVASDLAAILGYRIAPHMLRMLESDQKGIHLVDTLGGEQRLSIVTEGGMWTCVIRSKRAEAKRFVRWLTDILLPTLRKTGSFTLENTPAIEPDTARLNAGVATVRAAHRLFGIGVARAIWRDLGLPLPESAMPAIDDGLAGAIAAWIERRDRFTFGELADGLGLGHLDHATKRRMADILAASGYDFRKTRRGTMTVWAWHQPLPVCVRGDVA